MATFPVLMLFGTSGFCSKARLLPLGLLFHISVTSDVSFAQLFCDYSFSHCPTVYLLFSLAFPFLAFGASISGSGLFPGFALQSINPSVSAQQHLVIVPGLNWITKSCLVKGQPYTILVGLGGDKEFHSEPHATRKEGVHVGNNGDNQE
ncbi:Uncharacterized protein Fot_18571 [Forsythia ovata]|uniref:Uncharacterized protein n=1 Tax=Forsythia ovata TaxID=205694 RepID=A0ABD1VIK5_9LAMI